MQFNSLEFLFFFPIVVFIYFLIPRKIKHLWLLFASYFFYMCWNARYVFLLFFSTIVTYASGLFIEKVKVREWDNRKKQKYKKIIVGISVILNLLILFWFKYINFTLNVAASMLAYINIQLSVPTFDIILPVGISFYTFQALSYTMDVYRGKIYAEKDFFRYALFVSFFPQLVAGPIERSSNLLRQLATPQKFCFEKAKEGLLLILWGLFLKMVIADRIAMFVDTVYEDYEVYAGCYLMVATVFFAVQIYCDFYGYSVIAMGVAKTLGIQLMENFNAPYLSESVSEFWKKWHISLTSWFKDYLYIPLGGGKKGKTRKYINKLAVFLISGLWHGAQFSFIVWGGINGLYQVIGEMLQPVRDRVVSLLHLNRDTFGHKFYRIVRTFILVDFSLIFFRADGFEDSFEIIRNMFTVKNPWVLFDGSLYQCGLDSKNFNLMMICIGILFFADLCKYKGVEIRKIIISQDFWFRGGFFILAVMFILIFGIYGSSLNEASFIYFQF